MRKKYLCAECKAECAEPTYLRLHLTACGWRRSVQPSRSQRSIRVGHFCESCLWARVRTAMGRDFKPSQVESHSRPASLSPGLRTQEASS